MIHLQQTHKNPISLELNILLFIPFLDPTGSLAFTLLVGGLQVILLNCELINL